MTRVLPAILPESFEDLESHLLQVRGLTRMVQIDICDGRLTPNPTWPYIKNTGDEDDEFGKIISQDSGLPLWEDFDFEIDLMVANPAKEYEKWIDAGASRIIFHVPKKVKKIVEDDHQTESLFEIMRDTKERGVEVGLALTLDEPLSLVEDLRDLLDSIQLMGIENVGYQSQPFSEKVLARVLEAKEKFQNIPISVDGGVNTETAGKIVKSGADVLIVGSGIFGSFDVEESLDYFENI